MLYSILLLFGYKTKLFFITQDPLLMYPEEGKKISRIQNTAEENDFDLYYTTMTPLPPPRHKLQDTGKMSNLNLIEL